MPALPSIREITLPERGFSSLSRRRRVIASAVWTGAAIGAGAAALLAADALWLRAVAVVAVAGCSVLAARYFALSVAAAGVDEHGLEEALALANVGYWTWDLRRGALYYSPTCGTALGHDPAELRASLSAWGKLVHPDDLPRARAALDAWIAGQAPQYDLEVRLRAADGSWRRIRDRGHRLEYAGDGRVTRATGLHIDIDRRRSVPSDASEGWMLIVDDDPDVRLIIETAARRLGYRAFSVDRAATALAVVAALPDVRIVITDHDMPGMTGIELAAALRSVGSDVPVLLTSGRSRDELGVAAASAFLPKPFSVDELRQALARLLPPPLDRAPEVVRGSIADDGSGPA